MTYVLYHANCWDGFCAAWVARNALKKTDSDIKFIPVQYGQPVPGMEVGSSVYILDFSYKRQDTVGIIGQMSDVTILDHHKTAEQELSGIADLMARHGPTIVFNMNKSGGRLTWEFFHGVYGAPSPWLVDYTEDRDLWRWDLACSKEINAFIRSWPLTFNRWDEFSRVGPGCEKWDTWIDAGSAILRREQQIIDDHLRHGREIEMDGHKILAVNATVLFSDIAGELAKGRPFGACYFDRSDGKRQWSLRSRDGGVDVAEIAKQHGGGGHRNAAGFEEDGCTFTGAQTP